MDISDSATWNFFICYISFASQRSNFHDATTSLSNSNDFLFTCSIVFNCNENLNSFYARSWCHNCRWVSNVKANIIFILFNCIVCSYYESFRLVNQFHNTASSALSSRTMHELGSPFTVYDNLVLLMLWRSTDSILTSNCHRNKSTQWVIMEEEKDELTRTRAKREASLKETISAFDHRVHSLNKLTRKVHLPLFLHLSTPKS